MNTFEMLSCRVSITISCSASIHGNPNSAGGAQITGGNCFKPMHTFTKLTFIKTLSHINHQFSLHLGCGLTLSSHIDL